MLVLAVQAEVARDGPFGKLQGKDMGHQLLLEVLGGAARDWLDARAAL